MKIKVLYKQTLLDIAIMATGTANSVFTIALENNMSITQTLAIGTEISIPAAILKNIDVINYYKKFNFQPATGLAIENTKRFRVTQSGVHRIAQNNDKRIL